MDKTYEECLRLQENKHHMYTDLEYDKIYTLKILDISTDNGVKIKLEVVNSVENLLEVDIEVDVIENNFQNIHFNYPEDSNFIRIKKNGIIETLKYILELLKKDIKDEDLVGESSEEFKPYYSRTPNILINKDEE
ncbi:hypothetical protein [Gemella sanguinis]|uniref:hypothetical protein n=1 Tax=Gemella sanguinis TaxID=84135 RepID=UPI0028E594A7|nr:hypothetical protein [Gemella sanguinis]